MREKNSINSDKEADYLLDITAEVCPMTFVRTKLLLERMKPGETALLRLKGAEPLDNVPRNLRDHGEEILFFDLETPGDDAKGVHRLLLRKS